MPTQDEPVANSPEPPPVPQPPDDSIPVPEPTPPIPDTPAAEPLPPGLRLVSPSEAAPPEEPEVYEERQTLAQMFSLLPLQARIGILIALAVTLTIGVLLVLWPRANAGANIEAGATETAVAAIFTLTAQPTPTAIGTDTPRIYIVEESPTPSLTPDFTATPIVYVVRQGDTVNNIARRYGVTVQDIATANGLLNANSIAVGQELIIPTPGPGTAVPTANNALTGTPGAPNSVATANTLPPIAYPQLVIQAASPAEGTALRIAAGADYQAITYLPRGTFAGVVAKSPDGRWYLIQLEDGYTRGWVPADAVAFLYPADPANISTTPAP